MKWLKRIGAVVTALGLINQAYDWYVYKYKPNHRKVDKP